MQILTPEQLDSKTVERWFEKKAKQAILEGWKCTKCHTTCTAKNKPLFRIRDYMSDDVPLPFNHTWC
jgi:Na+-translocating ferredoxin:NAD+ oxidoreductase RnfC subunit